MVDYIELIAILFEMINNDAMISNEEWFDMDIDEQSSLIWTYKEGCKNYKYGFKVVKTEGDISNVGCQINIYEIRKMGNRH